MNDLYQTITQRIVYALEAGHIPWHCPWDPGYGALLPINATTQRPYRGVNLLLLNLTAQAQGFPANRWLTYHQAQALGAHVRRGESGWPIVFFKLHEVADERRAALAHPSPVPTAANDDPGRRVVPLMRSYTVFNVSQVEGLPAAMYASPAHPPGWDPVLQAEQLLADTGATVRHGGHRAFYRPSDDIIQLPPREVFESAKSYYGVALHELTHWTGHPSRCNRPLGMRHGLDAYAYEELVAEMGTAFLCSHCGLNAELQHASYIGEWLQALRNDKRLIFRAASLAQKAADFVLPPAAQMAGAASTDAAA